MCTEEMNAVSNGPEGGVGATGGGHIRGARLWPPLVLPSAPPPPPRSVCALPWAHPPAPPPLMQPLFITVEGAPGPSRALWGSRALKTGAGDRWGPLPVALGCGTHTAPAFQPLPRVPARSPPDRHTPVPSFGTRSEHQRLRT